MEEKLYCEDSLWGTSFLLYDLSRVYFEAARAEGRARYGHNRDDRWDRRRVFLLDCDLCTRSSDFL
ncbi:hypothetical protein MPNT_170042 [Candidatus Methylacidithermus pantelleriae]|uniref:Uncharacterized protein n=1 Tax=Candidatus Methylacidithermus pantelleriae TaxID=2744239 RepID=A0A8J2FVP5_9BACT|nr:hypothetical protein MPNT_170042 [Candidatus Methylacidithermus pantelleriae]